jgi:hypothetical protein
MCVISADWVPEPLSATETSILFKDLVNILLAGGEHQNGDGIVLRPQAAIDLQIVHHGEHYIQHDQGGTQARCRFESRFAIPGRFDAEILSLQVHARQFDDGRLVVHE